MDTKRVVINDHDIKFDISLMIPFSETINNVEHCKQTMLIIIIDFALLQKSQ